MHFLPSSDFELVMLDPQSGEILSRYTLPYQDFPFAMEVSSLQPQPIPVLGPSGAMLLVLVLAVCGALLLRTRM
jgi:hypothetical protein